jgi:hypothetical protein
LWDRIKPCSVRENEFDEYILLGVDADEGEKYDEAAGSQRTMRASWLKEK